MSADQSLPLTSQWMNEWMSHWGLLFLVGQFIHTLCTCFYSLLGCTSTQVSLALSALVLLNGSIILIAILLLLFFLLLIRFRSLLIGVRVGGGLDGAACRVLQFLVAHVGRARSTCRSNRCWCWGGDLGGVQLRLWLPRALEGGQCSLVSLLFGLVIRLGIWKKGVFFLLRLFVSQGTEI